MGGKNELKNRQKQKYFEEWMLDEHVLVQLDARKPGVEVPDHLEANPALTLKLSYLFQGQITHDEQAITAYLRFSGNYHRCVVPWEAIWGMTSSTGKNQVWTEDLPREVVMQFARQKISELGRKLFGRESKQDQPRDSRQEPAAEPEPAKETESTSPDDKPPKRPTLTRIK